jgi:hypothetical protein
VRHERRERVITTIVDVTQCQNSRTVVKDQCGNNVNESLPIKFFLRIQRNSVFSCDHDKNSDGCSSVTVVHHTEGYSRRLFPRIDLKSTNESQGNRAGAVNNRIQRITIHRMKFL